LIELRSDTFSPPSRAILQAALSSPLGDDGYGEDPTVAQLERFASGLLGKEAACLMPSGTMANLAALLTHCERGTKAIVGAESDLFVYEAGGASACGGIAYDPLPNEADGTIALERIRAALEVDRADAQFAHPGAVCLETPHSLRGGVPLQIDYLREAKALSEEFTVPLHLDAARLLNAAIALCVEPATIAASADSVQFCLSKGIAAPVGSLLLGSAEFVARARRARKMLGGGMRQAGVIAGPGLVALEGATDRLAQDHTNAAALARGLADLEGVERVISPATNCVVFEPVAGIEAAELIDAAHEAGVRLLEFGRGRVRAMTHRGIDETGVERALAIIGATLSMLEQRGAHADGPAPTAPDR
jgi:threonine aldolase